MILAQRRRLQDNFWGVGKFSFEDSDQLLIQAEGKEIRVKADEGNFIVDG